MPSYNKTFLNLKNASIQGFYWMSFCVGIGFSSVFLLDKGYSNTEIGIILAIANFAAILLQSYVASFADRASHISLNRITSFCIMILMFLMISLYFFNQKSILLTILVIVAYCFLTILQPLINAMNFEFEKVGISLNFGLARGSGSLFYAIASSAAGILIARFSPSYLPLYSACLLLILMIITFSFQTPVTAASETDKQTDSASSLVSFIKKYRIFMLFLVGMVLLIFCQYLVNQFMIQILSEIGGGSKEMGYSLSLAGLLELPAMFGFSFLMRHFDCRTLLRVCSIFYITKYILTLFASSVGFFYLAQAMQIGSYALLIPASVYFTNGLVEKSDSVKGQALLSAASNMANVAACLAGGWMLDHLGNHNTILVGLLLSIPGMLLVYYTTSRRKSAKK